MYEECNGAEKYYFYDSNGVISGIRHFDAEGNMTMIYVVTNALGDVIALYDKDGNAVVKYEYDAWGNIISTTNTTEGSSLDWNEVNPFRYRGYYYDSEIGLYYLQSRYYDSETGRFINADHYVSTGLQVTNFNMFAYCYNNPVNMADVYGDWPKWVEEATAWVNEKVIEPLGEIAYKVMTDICNAQLQKFNAEYDIAMAQQEMVKGAFSYVADLHYQGMQMQSASQRQQGEAIVYLLESVPREVYAESLGVACASAVYKGMENSCFGWKIALLYAVKGFVEGFFTTFFGKLIMDTINDGWEDSGK